MGTERQTFTKREAGRRKNRYACAAAAWLIAGALCAHAQDKSGMNPNTINVPKGPGSIEGLGQSFQPQLNTGGAPYEIVLVVPPGAPGRAPELKLSYGGGGGNGPAGFGWSLTVPCIERRTYKGVPRYVDAPNGRDDDQDGEIDERDEIDEFVNEGGVLLTPAANGDFFCRFEESFQRYRRVGERWECTLADGTRQEYGVTAEGRVFDPETGRVGRWCLQRQTDPNGNVTTFHYKTFPAEQNLNGKYLWKIEYGAGALPRNALQFVVFEYENRNDWFEDCTLGFAVRTGMRVRRVLMGTQGAVLPGHLQGDFNQDGVADYLARAYRIAYETHPHWSLVSSVTVIGADGQTGLPPARFTYTVCNPPATLNATGAVIESLNEPEFVMDSKVADLVDLNGDGVADILKTEAFGGVHQAYLNLGERETAKGRAIAWSEPADMSSADGLAWGIDLSSNTVVAHLADMDGDGLSDLVYKSIQDDLYYFRNTGSMGWSARGPLTALGESPPSPFERFDVRQADVDNDKNTDIIQSVSVGENADYRIWFNQGDGRFARPTTIPQDNGWNFDDTGVQLLDFNGDRLPDLVRLRALSVQVQAGLGRGAFAPMVAVPFTDGPLEDNLLPRTALRDLTGDGLPELVVDRAEPGVVWYWINLGNYTFDVRRVIRGMPTGIGAEPAVRWADINGNGTTDLIYCDREVVPKMQTVDLGRLMGCEPSVNLMTGIDNGIGRITTIEYTPSTYLALADAASGEPWPGPMPMKVDVVTRVTVSDSLGDEYVTEYTYHDGYYDRFYKTFRGFGYVEQFTRGAAGAPTLVNRFYFHNGRENLNLKGMLRLSTTESEDGGVFEETETTWNARVLYVGTNGEPATFAHPVSTEKRIVELGLGTPRETLVEYEYDRYGNVTREANYGIVEGDDLAAFADERITVKAYAVNTDAWIVHAPMREEVRDLAGNVFSRLETYYDDPAFTGDNLGSVTRGNKTLVKAWLDPSDADSVILLNRFAYDEYGNVVLNLDPLASAPGGAPDADVGHYREIAYDPVFHAFAVRETAHAGNGSAPLTYTAEYDGCYGTITRFTELNGEETVYGYDDFARLTHIIEPGDSPEFPTEEYSYHLAQAVSGGTGLPYAQGLCNFIEIRKLDRTPGSGPRSDCYHLTRKFVDGLGRPLMTKEEAEDDPDTGAPRVAVSGATRFNARTRPAYQLQAYYTMQSGGTLEALLAFEDVRAPGWQGSFHENGALVARDLAHAHKLQYEYDAMLRSTRVVTPDGASSRTEYEPFVRKAFDQNDADPASPHYGTPSIAFQDGLGRLVRVDEQARLNDDGTPAAAIRAWTTRYAYDVNDQLTRITDAQGNVRIMQYDGRQRLTYLDDPDRGGMQFAYDAASNLVQTEDAKRQVVEYAYDGVNRIVSEEYRDEGLPFSANRSPDVRYFYDAPLGPVDLGAGETATPENTAGKLAAVQDLAGEEHFSYDARGRIAWSVKRVPDPATGSLLSYTTRLEHDSMDRLVALTYPDGDRVEQGYGRRTTLDRISGGGLSNLDSVPYVLRDAEQTPAGKPAALAFGNGERTEFRFDSRGRLAGLRTFAEDSPGNVLMDYQYAFDGVTNIVRIEDERPAALVPQGSPRRNTQSFTYDALYRLTRARFSYAAPGQTDPADRGIDYRYDRVGNMLAQTSNIEHFEDGRSVTHLGAMQYGGVLGASGRVGHTPNVPGPHALTGADGGARYTYDANGNVTRADGVLLTWDFKDRVAAVERTEADGAVTRAEYTYDYMSRRITKRVWRREAGAAAFPETLSSFAVYVSKYFELRDDGRPVKYVWYDQSRIARVLGTLEPGEERIQQFRLFPGWNLLSMPLDAENAAGQLGVDADSNIEGCFLWRAETKQYVPLHTGDALPAGSVFWLKVRAAETLEVRGAYVAGAAQSIPENGGFITPSGSDAVPLAEVLPANTVVCRLFDAAAQRWVTLRSGETADIGGVEAPSLIAPGQALFVRTSDPVVVPAPALRAAIEYYHADHIGSTAVVTDGAGAVLSETAYYPFGEVRNDFEPEGSGPVLPLAYQFLQKERDAESGFQYFEMRYLAGRLGRFLSVDPLTGEWPRDALLDPQMLHPYAYSRNNPVTYVDPDGNIPEEKKKISRPSWLGWLPTIDFEKASDRSGRMGAFLTSFKKTLYGMAQEEKDPGLYLKFNDAHKKLGLHPDIMQIKRKGKVVHSVYDVVSEQDIADAIDKAANERIGKWVDKIRTKLGLPLRAETLEQQEIERNRGKFNNVLEELLQRTQATRSALDRDAVTNDVKDSGTVDTRSQGGNPAQDVRERQKLIGEHRARPETDSDT